ncbi:MAG: ATP-binding protein [Ignavibacteriaceae bacterium]
MNKSAKDSHSKIALTDNMPAFPEFSLQNNLDDKLINNIPNVFFWSSVKEGTEEKISYSQNIASVTGYSPGEVLSLPGRGMAIIIEDDLPHFKKNLFDFVNDTQRLTTNIVYRIFRKDKKIIWLNEYLTVKRDETGKVNIINGIVTDITVIKEEEEKLKVNLDILKQTNESKDKFISILSHDLRAPFTSILGFSEILISESNLSPAERHEYLTYIYDSSQNQLQLINYLLDWTRLQTGRIKVEPQRLNAQTLVYNCISSLTGNAIRKNLDIKVNVDENLYIQADERLVTQVVTNLLSNAIKFSAENKTIDVGADIFNDEFIEFIVKDYGTGISDVNKAKLFKIEKMFSTEGTKGEKGTGLGLSLVKEIIDKHSGQIWFYSEQGEGSEFHFTVPCSLNTILVVENNPADKVLFEKILKKYFPSFNILLADNGFEAIEVIAKKSPSLIITDHEMPLMNGIQLLETLRREGSLKIPVIAIVTTIADEIKAAYEDFGIRSVLQKPVDIDVLCGNIKSALN